MYRDAHRRRAAHAWLAAAALVVASSPAAAQNLIADPGVEDDPPPNWGNNIGHPIEPWILGPGDDSNVVRVDGSVDFNYGDSGPQFDAWCGRRGREARTPPSTASSWRAPAAARSTGMN